MAVINREQKWLYCMEPHTASRAVNNALVQFDDCEEVGKHHEPPLSLVTHDVLGFDFICAVRNPLSVMITLWHNRADRRMTFRDWVLRRLGLQSPIGGFHSFCNIICWYEDLQEDIDYVLGRHVPLGREDWHATPGKGDWWSHYDEETFAVATDYHREYLDMFGYEVSLDGTVTIKQKQRRKPVGYGRFEPT